MKRNLRFPCDHGLMAMDRKIFLSGCAALMVFSSAAHAQVFNSDETVNGADGGTLGNPWVSSSSSLAVGSGNAGSLVISDGGVVSVVPVHYPWESDGIYHYFGVQIGSGTESAGSVVVTGVGSTLLAGSAAAPTLPASVFSTGRFEVGTQGGSGNLTIANGGMVNTGSDQLLVGDISYTGKGSVIVDGFSSTLNVKEVIVGNQFSNVAVTNGGSLVAIGDHSSEVAGGGTLVVDGLGSSFVASGLLLQGDSSALVQGSKLAFSNSSVGTIGSLSLVGNSIVAVGGNSSLQADRLELKAGGGTGLPGTARLNVESGGLLNATYTDLEAGSTLSVASGGQITGRSISVEAGTLDIAHGGLVSLTGAVQQWAGSTTTVDGELHSSLYAYGGIVNGTGTIIGDVTLGSGATLAPGHSPGLLTIDGDLLLSGGTLELQVGGLGEGEFDRVLVTGNANLSGGTLAISFLDAALAESLFESGGFSLDFLSADGSVSGLDNVALAFYGLGSSSSTPAYTFSLDGGSLAVALAATAPVPLPAGLWLLGSGLAGLFGFSRKRAVAA